MKLQVWILSICFRVRSRQFSMILWKIVWTKQCSSSNVLFFQILRRRKSLFRKFLQEFSSYLISSSNLSRFEFNNFYSFLICFKLESKTTMISRLWFQAMIIQFSLRWTSKMRHKNVCRWDAKRNFLKEKKQTWKEENHLRNQECYYESDQQKVADDCFCSAEIEREETTTCFNLLLMSKL